MDFIHCRGKRKTGTIMPRGINVRENRFSFCFLCKNPGVNYYRGRIHDYHIVF